MSTPAATTPMSAFGVTYHVNTALFPDAQSLLPVEVVRMSLVTLLRVVHIIVFAATFGSVDGAVASLVLHDLPCTWLAFKGLSDPTRNRFRWFKRLIIFGCVLNWVWFIFMAIGVGSAEKEHIAVWVTAFLVVLSSLGVYTWESHTASKLSAQSLELESKSATAMTTV